MTNGIWWAEKDPHGWACSSSELKGIKCFVMLTFYQTAVDFWSTLEIFGYIFVLLSASVQIETYGEIYASILPTKDGMVCFHDNPEKYNNPAMLHKIDQEVRLSNSVYSVVFALH